LLWIVLVNYSQAVVGALIAAFVVTLLIFAMAFCARLLMADKWLPAPSSPPPNTSSTSQLFQEPLGEKQFLDAQR